MYHPVLQMLFDPATVPACTPSLSAVTPSLRGLRRGECADVFISTMSSHRVVESLGTTSVEELLLVH